LFFPASCWMTDPPPVCTSGRCRIPTFSVPGVPFSYALPFCSANPWLVSIQRTGPDFLSSVPSQTLKPFSLTALVDFSPVRPDPSLIFFSWWVGGGGGGFFFGGFFFWWGVWGGPGPYDGSYLWDTTSSGTPYIKNLSLTSVTHQGVLNPRRREMRDFVGL